MIEKHDHDGHRDRMRKKYMEHGAEIFERHEMLEMLLYYAVPRKDTNKLAHELINSFGSLSGVFDAPPHLLKSMGLTTNVIVLLKLIPDMMSIYLEERERDLRNKIMPDDMHEIFKCKFFGKTREMLYLVLFDSKFNEIYSGLVSKGDLRHVEIDIRNICQTALMYNARYAVLSHNHLNGSSLPSYNDIYYTAAVNEALAKIGVTLAEHYVVAGTESLSFTNAGVLFSSVKEFEESPLFEYYSEKTRDKEE